MLNLFISPFPSTIITTDEDPLEMRVYHMLIEREDSLVLLNECTDIGVVQNVTLFRHRRFPRFQEIRMDIPRNIQNAIIRFLNHYHTKRHVEFDCYAFANLAHEVKQHPKEIGRMYWNVQSRPLRLRPGAIVFLMNREASFFHHAAVYLGYGLFLSVYGGHLYISKLRDMKKDFGAERVFLATPHA